MSSFVNLDPSLPLLVIDKCRHSASWAELGEASFGASKLVVRVGHAFFGGHNYCFVRRLG